MQVDDGIVNRFGTIQESSDSGIWKAVQNMISGRTEKKSQSAIHTDQKNSTNLPCIIERQIIIAKYNYFIVMYNNCPIEIYDQQVHQKYMLCTFQKEEKLFTNKL